MGYLNKFGFNVYRLKEAKVDKEFLLYDKDNDEVNFYSLSRLYQILDKELLDKGVDVKKFGVEELDLTPKQAKPKYILDSWVGEEHILINNIGFKPTRDKIFIKQNKKYFNLFKYTKMMNNKNYILDNPISFNEFKNKSPFHFNLFMNLHNHDELAIQDTLMKIADKLKYPHEKAQDCIIFYPGEGSGKGIFYKYILQPIFENYASKILMKRLNSDFNGFIQKALVLVLEEGKRDLELIETLKEVITEGSLLINEKGKNATEEDIYFLTFVFSNNMNPIDLGKRRGSYHNAHSLGKDIEESQEIGRKLCSELPKETEYLLQYLHNLEFKHQDALLPFNTKAKEQVTDLNKNTLELFYDFLLTYKDLDKACLYLQDKRYEGGRIPEFFFNIEKFKTKKSKDPEEFYICKDIIKEAYNHFCHIEGFKTNLIRHNKDIVQLWALFKMPVDSFQRIIVKQDSKNQGRRLDHVRLKDLVQHLKDNYKGSEDDEQ